MKDKKTAWERIKERASIDPEFMGKRRAANLKAAKKHYRKNLAKCRADAARRMRKYRASGRRTAYDAEYIRTHKAEIAARAAEVYWFGGGKERMLALARRRREEGGDEYRKRMARKQRERRARLKAAARTARLRDLDLDALAAYLKHGRKPRWMRKVDHASPYCADNLTASQRAYAAELFAERREWREANA